MPDPLLDHAHARRRSCGEVLTRRNIPNPTGPDQARFLELMPNVIGVKRSGETLPEGLAVRLFASPQLREESARLSA